MDKNGFPKYKGGGRARVNPTDVIKASKRFKLKANLINGSKLLGTVGNIYGLATTINEATESGEITILEAMDILMGVVAFIPGYGWVISGSWSIMRLTIPETFNPGVEMSNGIRRFGE